jgi:ATP-dependent Lon protease
LLTLLDTQETQAKLRRYNNATHDISQLKIILINHSFTEVLGKEEGMALESRVNLVRFDHFEDDKKLDIAWQHVKQRCKEQGLDSNRVDPAVIQAIVEEDTAAGYQGVRMMLQVIDQYIRILEQGALIGDLAGVPPLVFDIKEEYKNKLNQPGE